MMQRGDRQLLGDRRVGLLRGLVLAADLVGVAQRPARPVLLEQGHELLVDGNRGEARIEIGGDRDRPQAISAPDVGRLPGHLEVGHLLAAAPSGPVAWEKTLRLSSFCRSSRSAPTERSVTGMTLSSSRYSVVVIPESTVCSETATSSLVTPARWARASLILTRSFFERAPQLSETLRGPATSARRRLDLIHEREDRVDVATRDSHLDRIPGGRPQGQRDRSVP